MTEESVRFLTSHDRAQLRLFPGLRNAVGVVVPIIVGILIGHVLAAVAVAIGAQVAGFAGLNGTARKRVRTMLFAAIWMSIATFVGAITGSTWLSVALIAVFGFATGLLVSVNNEAGLVGMWATIALIFITGFHEDPLHALVSALLVLGGALLQMLLMIALDWTQTSNAETVAVADVYLAVANYVRTPVRRADLRVAASLLEADERMGDTFLNPAQWQKLRLLLDLAESVRIEMVALTGLIRTLDQEQVQREVHLQEVTNARTTIANLLQAIATSLKVTKPLRIADLSGIGVLQKAVDQSAAAVGSHDLKHAYARIARANDELMRVVRVLGADGAHVAPRLSDAWVRLPYPQLRSSYGAIRANLTFQSATFRHAIRLAVALAVASIIAGVSPLARGYWLPLTTLVILKPEFSTTFTRGVARVLGTLIGALFATWLLTIPDQTHAMGVVVVGVFLTGMYAVMNYNMVLFSCLLTAEVVVLLSFFQQVPPMLTIVDRVVYTIAGSLLAFITYIAWPTWQHRNVPSAIADLVSAQRSYLQTLLLTDADRVLADLRTSRQRVRLARTNAVNLVDQVMAEPVSGAWDHQAMLGLLTALHRFSDLLLSLESHLALKYRGLRSDPDTILFAQYMDRCLMEIESVLREGASINRAALPEGALDETSPFTKQQLLEMDIPHAVASVFIRMEDNVATLFRLLPSAGVHQREQQAVE